ncbi:SE1561 family protein [Bacillus paralicheniformis]|nr:SE1561 family protein [Bacillus paralicheniformis]
MGNAVHDKEQQVNYLKNRLDMFMSVIDSLDPESTDLEDIDRLISMLDDLEAKYERFKKTGNKTAAFFAAVFLFSKCCLV